MDINDKLKTLTLEQAKQLGASLNSCYPDKKPPVAATKEASSTQKKNKK